MEPSRAGFSSAPPSIFEGNNADRGFTLIELSIVLVVIGLLIGGVLAGQELIYASHIRKMGTELQQISVAVNTFRIKFDCLPGDCANATTFFGVNSSGCPNGGGASGTCDGNGDGFINAWGALGNVEHLFVWQQLSLAKLIPWSFSGTTTYGVGNVSLSVGQNLPTSNFNTGIGYNLYSARSNVAGAWKKTIEIGAVPAPPSVNRDVLSGAGLTGPQASSLDMKFDDGNPQSGKIYAVSGGSTLSTLTSVLTQVSATNPNITCVSSGAYLTSASSGCTMEYTPDIL